MTTEQEWLEFFSVIEENLLHLQKISLDPDVPEDERLLAIAEIEPAKIALRNMKLSRGFIPGKVEPRQAKG